MKNIIPVLKMLQIHVPTLEYEMGHPHAILPLSHRNLKPYNQPTDRIVNPLLRLLSLLTTHTEALPLTCIHTTTPFMEHNSTHKGVPT